MPQHAVFMCLVVLSCWIGLASTSNAEVDLSFAGVTRLPQSRVIPGGVLALTASVGNKGDEVGQGTIVANIVGVGEMQSGRLISVAPGERVQVEFYLQLPESIGSHEKIEIVFTMLVNDGKREVILSRDGVLVRYTMTLPVELRPTLAALVPALEPAEVLPWHWPPKGVDASYEMIIASRIDSGNERQMTTFDGSSLPLNQSDWDDCELIVISNETVFENAAAVEALRRFLMGGGRIWVMLSQVACESIRPLLDTDQICELVDQVELNNFSVELGDRHHTLSESDRTILSEDPIVMKRVVQSGGIVTHQVLDWPAVIKMSVGYGELVLITLDSPAWIEPRKEQRNSDPRLQSAYQLRPWSMTFAKEVNEPRAERPLLEEVDYPLKHIGNPVVPRGRVALALLGYCGLIAGAGLWRAFVGDLRPMGFIGPLAAVVASGTLLFAASWERRDIPESVARLQIIEVARDGRFALAREQAAVFLNAVSAMKLESKLDGQARAKEGMSSGIRRYVVEDFQKWQLMNEAWPLGVWRYNGSFVLETAGLVVAARLTEQGIDLELPQSLPSAFEDPVLGYVVGDPMIGASTTDGVVVDGRVTVDGERWISNSLITDEQQRRLEIYQDYFQPEVHSQKASRVLYGWTTLWDGPKWDRDLAKHGSALVALPVQLERPDEGTRVFVPHGLIQLRRKQNQVVTTTAFSERTGKWASEVSLDTVAELEFVLPAEILPFSAESIDMDLDISAPQRMVTVSVVGPSGMIELAKLESPSTPWRKTITDPSVLNLINDGVLEVNLQISGHKEVAEQLLMTKVVTWEIDHFYASLRGIVQAVPLIIQP